MTSLEIIPMSNSVASTVWKSQEAEVGMVIPIPKHITTHPGQGKSPYIQIPSEDQIMAFYKLEVFV